MKAAAIALMLVLLFSVSTFAQDEAKKAVQEKSKELAGTAQQAIFGGLSGTTRDVVKAALPWLVIIMGIVWLLEHTKKTFDSPHTTQQKERSVKWGVIIFLALLAASI